MTEIYKMVYFQDVSSSTAISLFLWFLFNLVAINQSEHSSRLHRFLGSTYQINPKPCFSSGKEGTCMFVWECIKTEGIHLGMCMEGFMFGSCCGHDVVTNSISVDSTLGPVPTSTTKRTDPLSTSLSKPISTQDYSLLSALATVVTAKPLGVQTPPDKTSTVVDHMTSVALDKENPYSDTTTTFHTSSSPQSTLYPISTKRPHKPRPKPPRPSIGPISYLPKPTIGPISLLPKPPSTTPEENHSDTTTTTTSTPTTSQTSRPFSGSMLITDPPPTTVPSTLAPHANSSRKFECGVPPLFPRPEYRIVGGKTSSFGAWPWQVSVRRTSFFGFSTTHRCGGALINEQWVATAGHCVDDLLISQIRVRLGEYDFSSVLEPYPYVEKSVVKKVVHPKYNFITYEYDLALIKMEEPISFMPNIYPVCLPGNDDLLIGEKGTVTGWGRLSAGGTLPSILQQVQVPIMSNQACKELFQKGGRNEYIPDIFLCAGYEMGAKDSCQGDSGGPLQVRGKDGRWFLAGIISWGIGCAEPFSPGVCTRISKFRDYILQTVT